MDIRRRRISFVTCVSLLYITSAVGSLINEARDAAILEPERLTATLEMQIVSPVDDRLLQQGYLNIWRGVRTIDEVVRHNRSPRVYLERMQKLGPKLLKINPSESQIAAIQRDALEWAKHKPHVNLAVVTYYLIEVMKAHSPEDTHKEIQRLAKGISDRFKFNYPKKSQYARKMVLNFMDTKMSQIGLHLVMEGLSKDSGVDRGVGLDTLINSRTHDWKNSIPKADRAAYTEHYQRYMNLIEVFEILSGAGIQNRNVIKSVNAKTPLRLARKIFSDESSQPRLIHRYLINAKPHDRFQPLELPIFGYAVMIEGGLPAKIEATVRKLWKSSGQDDIRLASRLSANLNTILGGRIYCPKRLRLTRGYRALTTKYTTVDPLYNQMWKRVSRTVIDVVKLEEKNPEERSILWRILGSAFIVSSKDFEREKFERHVENSVMFYLFIRRIGEVLEKAVEIHFPETKPEEKLTRSQFMRYYWALVTYQSVGEKNKKAKTAHAKQFTLGRVYLNHVIASRELKNLYNRLNQEEEAILPRSNIVKGVKRRITGKRTHSQTDRSAWARNPDDGLETLQKASTSSPAGQSVISDHNRDRLNFKIPRKKSSRYPHSVTSNIAPPDENAITQKALQRSAKKRKLIIDSLVGSHQRIPGGSKKKPRIEAAVSSSSEGGGSQFPTQEAGPRTPSMDLTQNTPHYPHSELQAASHDSNTYGELRSSSQPLVETAGAKAKKPENLPLDPELTASILPASGKSFQPSSKHTSSLDLNKPAAYSDDHDVHIMLPDLNEPLEPISPQEDAENGAHDTPMYPSVFEPNGGEHSQHTSSPQVTSREEIPDLNI
ncbi:uncharacterized protein MELLADRAFT_109986 [Melampsora larici-populina 98AG31]|uniref:Secreted protein n=1 Tax=Melampsora larici-populina (strain 98AG31 / pathotype 3-4-7) TaxID=747676 RepID=F4RY99_MELLP|nr:uncharacterized protein MELLADRAFT_109986 [Melampsora larici-populina 98AG31]EGG02641.1 hypothetical protein MELLADRAFT_109986 [Melampsora larici-populina 98AG31]